MHEESFWSDPRTYVTIAFFIFVGLAARKGWQVIAKMLDDRADKIRAELDEAARLRHEAEAMLATAEARRAETEAEAKALIEGARAEAKRLADAAAADARRPTPAANAWHSTASPRPRRRRSTRSASPPPRWRPPHPAKSWPSASTPRPTPAWSTAPSRGSPPLWPNDGRQPRLFSERVGNHPSPTPGSWSGGRLRLAKPPHPSPRVGGEGRVRGLLRNERKALAIARSPAPGQSAAYFVGWVAPSAGASCAAIRPAKRPSRASNSA